MKQLFDGTFTNQQLLAASCGALLVSIFGLWRLKLTGFAWTTAVLGVATWGTVLLLFNWQQHRAAAVQLAGQAVGDSGAVVFAAGLCGADRAGV